MPELKAFTGIPSKNDIYQGSENSNYVRDQTTGQLVLKSGINTRCIIPEQFSSATLIIKDNTAINATGNIYTVPDGKVFLMLGANLNVSSQAATFGNAAYLQLDSAPILRGYGSAEVTGCAYGMTQNFAAIIAVPEKVVIAVRSANANVRATGCVFGYEIDSSEYFPA